MLLRMTRTLAVRVALDLYDALDKDDRAAVLGLVSPSVEVVPAAPGASRVLPVQRGHEGFRRWWRRLDDEGLRVRLFVRDSWPVGDRAVCEVVVTNEKRGHLDIARVVWLVTTLDKSGRVTHNHSFRSREEAQAAAEALGGPSA
jgi:ketosteroid isomerase-like protein